MPCRPSTAAGDALAGRHLAGGAVGSGCLERFALCPSLAFQGNLPFRRKATAIAI